MRKYLVVLVSGLLFAAVVPCRGQDDRENFARIQDLDMGTYIDRFSPDLKKVRTLPNGNEEYETNYGVDGCIVVYEFDARTKRAVAWRTKGNTRRCVQAP